jgi:HlyD family secretion protein
MSKNVTASILQESKKTKQKSRLWWMISAAIIVFGGGVYFFFSHSSSEQVTAVAEVVSPTKGDLRVSIESDGTIINPNIIDLSFLVNGTLETINVVEGDRVEIGEELAALDTRDLEFDLRTAESSLQIAYANYKAKTAMLTDTQLRELENSLSSQQDELESITKGVDQDLQQALDLGVVDLEVAFPTLETALQTVDSILLIDTSYSDNYQFLSATHDSVGINKAKNMYQDVRRSFDALEEDYRSRSNISDTEVSVLLRNIRTLAQEVQELMDQMVDSARTATATSSVSQSKIDSVRSEINSLNSKVLSEVTSLTSTLQRIESAYLSQQSKIVSAENSITKLETQMETAIESVEEKEISKQTSLSVLSAQITQAQIKVDKAKYNLELAQLSAPISGEIIQLNGNEGEAIKIESTSSDTAFIKILSDSNFTTEVYVEEIDIAKIQKEQKVIITLDAIPDLELIGQVTFISSTATTSNSGVVTYLVRVEITDDQGAKIKEGMTTYVEFLTEEAVDAILVPSEAIQSRGNKVMVLLADGTPREVTVGVSDGSMTEIVSGLSVDEKILVGGTVASSAKSMSGGREMSEEMLSKMKEAGFTDGELEKIQAGEMTDEMREKMQALRGDQGASEGGRGEGGGPPR